MAYVPGQYHLTDLLQDVYEDLGELNTALATGGTTTTVDDSVLGETEGSDDDWKEAAIFITRDAGGADAAPQGEFQRVKAFTAATAQFEVDTAFSVAPASGDTYSYAGDLYPLRSMISLANAGLRKLGDIVKVDTTTLDTASQKTEYAYAVTWKRRPPIYVDIQGRTGDANDNRWQRIYTSDVTPADPGTAALLIIPQILNARDVRVAYIGSHPKLNAFDDIVSEYIHPDLAFAAVLERALSWQNIRVRGTDRSLTQKLNDAKTELNIAIVKHPIWKPDTRAKLFVSDNHYHEIGEPDKVRLSHHGHGHY